ncbi:MAG: NAD(P) transhydrogenase subunit alpha [Rickettsiales bacterium]|nr:MAG: NAD(P) transhydrogenase subunit alpha [Rickettsiales bacterium]
MREQLPSAIKEAAEISQKAAELTEKLRDISLHAPEVTGHVVDPLVFAVTIFALSCFIGYYVVWKVTPSLHTPLMSITNAISGIIIIGALISASSAEFGFSSALGFIAAFFAAINIFGGFIVTERMLEMFKKK